MEVAVEAGNVNVRRSALLRTARNLMSGEVYVPGAVWSNR
jgi:4-oxalomesaconate tautomerase